MAALNSPEALGTWRTILEEHAKIRRAQIVDLFDEGLVKLGINAGAIPDLQEVNRRLRALTGWEGVFVDGLEGARSFYALLAERRFPIGHFIRDRRDMSYTPAPDIVHDLYGHLPFFANVQYADFCQRFGERASRFANDPQKLVQFERLFWFTIEFGLIKTANGIRVFGAGIASSIGECKYALSNEPEVLPFDLDVVRNQDFRIDQMQKRLFLLSSPEQLYASLDQLCTKLEKEA